MSRVLNGRRTLGPAQPSVVVSILCLILTGPALGAAPSAGTSAAAGSASSGAGGLFSPTSTNFAHPEDKDGHWVDWGNWYKTIAPPWDPSPKEVLLCYQVRSLRDGNAPFLLRRVPHLMTSDGSVSPLPCAPIERPRGTRPMLHGDRLYVAVDLTEPGVAEFMKNVSMISLNVTLTVAPSLQPVLFRSNLGTQVTPPSLGGSAAGEELGNPESFGNCAKWLQQGANPNDPIMDSCIGLGSKYKRYALNAKTLSISRDPSVSANVSVLMSSLAKSLSLSLDANQKVNNLTSRDSVLILPWHYSLPGDVIPAVTLTALYTTPENLQTWQPWQFYPAGTVLKCPAEDECKVAATRPPGLSAGTEPKWPGIKNVSDGQIVWAPIVPNFKLETQHPLEYAPGDHIIWSNSSGAQTKSEIETWRPGQRYIKGQSVIAVRLPVPDPNGSLFQLFAANDVTPPGYSGNQEPLWTDPVTSDNHDQVQWKYVSPPANPGAGINERWQPGHPYYPGNVIRCELPSQKANACVAGNSGFTGSQEPWWAPQQSGPAASTATPQRDYQILWSAVTPATSLPAADQPITLVTEQLTQVHAPSLFGVSTAVLRTNKAIANSYSFPTQQSAVCPTAATTSAAATTCPQPIASKSRSTDIALLVSPYIFHHINAALNSRAVDGIDTESPWVWNDYQNWIPEPFVGFSLNSIGNNYYAGLSFEVIVRNFQVLVGEAWMKGPLLTSPIISTGAVPTATPETYTGLTRSVFVGVAFNVAGLVTGH